VVKLRTSAPLLSLFRRGQCREATCARKRDAIEFREGVMMRSQLTLLAVAAFAVAACAQTPAGGAESAGAAPQSANATVQAQEAVGVPVELSKKIDSKDAKVGDEVDAKTASDVRLADGTRVPRGSKIVGHVTDVTAKSHDNHDGRVAFTLDHVVLKDGHQIAIHAWMQAIAAPAPLSGADDMIGASGAGESSRGGPGGSAVGGGGVMGGSQAGAARGSTGPGGIVGTAGGAAGGALGQAGSTASGLGANTNASLGGNAGALNGAAGAASGLGPTGPVRNLSGVTFWTVSASGSGPTTSATVATSTVLNAQGKNVTLDSGSQMVLAVIPQPAAPAQ
jgi:hypothetical protein